METKSEIIRQLQGKDIDYDKVVCRVMDNPEQITLLLDVIFSEKGSIKFACEKVLRLVSEKQPQLLYPYFDSFVKILDSGNTFLKCGAIITIANLSAVDTGDKFNKIFNKYYSSVLDISLICACNVIGSSAKIVEAKPILVNRVVKELLKVEEAEYLSKGVVSPECRNIAIGQALNAFEQLYHKIKNKKSVNDFIKRQLKNTRDPVAKHAEKFLHKHRIV